MTRKFFISLLSLACALCLAACEDALGGSETDTHQHNWSSYYMMDGEKYYQTCAGCDEKKYADSEYDEKDLVVGIYIKSTDGFTYFWTNGSWSVAGFDKSADVSNVTIKKEYRGKPVTSIGEYAFYECTGLTSITIPDSVTSIEEGAFNECSGLTSITMPDGVTSIAAVAFMGCSSLKNVIIPDGVTSIGWDAFSNCSSLTSVTIPDGVTAIDGHAFFHCISLESITIPNDITSIGNCAFSGCSSLTSITFNGTKAQWQAIHYFANCAVICTDGEISR